jgi:hypothetical protein
VPAAGNLDSLRQSADDGLTIRGSTVGSDGACCGSIVDVRNLNAVGISESESEPKLHAETHHEPEFHACWYDIATSMCS